MNSTKSRRTLIFVLALGFAAYEAYSAWESIQARRWPTVSGKITACSRTYRRHSVTPLNNTVFAYAFSYQGKPYTGSRISCGGFEKYLGIGLKQKYPFGRPVTVHVDPQQPRNAVLTTDFAPSALVVFGVAIAALVGCVIYRE